jgi:hypothetical protein
MSRPCVRVHQHIIPDDMSVPSPAVLGHLGQGKANFAMKLSEKCCRHPKRSCTEHRHHTVRPVLAPIYRPIPRSERRSNPFSDSFKTKFAEFHFPALG